MFKPVEIFAEWLVYAVLKLTPDSHGAESLEFFVYDTIKIFILLAVIIFAISVIRTYISPQKIKAILSGKKKIVGNFLAATFGIVTPFCTCSAIPLFMGFLEAGVPIGATFSFLVASPMINEVALALLFAKFGWQVAAIYVVSGLVIAVVSGFLIGKLKTEDLIEKFAVQESRAQSGILDKMKFKYRAAYAKKYTLSIIKKVWLFILIGVGLGALIHGYVPTDFLAQYAGADKWYAVPFAVLIGIPLYSNAAGVIPLVSALTEKGVAMGTALAFMMAVTALSLPEFLILKRVMKTKLIAIFAGVVGIGIIFIGYLFNLII